MSEPAEPHVQTDYIYAPIPEEVLYSGLSDKAVRVYGVLMRHGLEPGSCFPSHARIAGFIGCEARSIQRPIKELEVAGWVDRVPRRGPDGVNTSPGYFVRTALLNAAPAPTSAGGPARGQRAPARAERKQGNESNYERKSDERAPRLLSVFGEHATEETAFALFWKEYPLKKGKGAALRAWPKALAAADFDAERIVLGARRYASDPKRKPDFTKHPTTWLNGECWDDEHPAAPVADERNIWDHIGASGFVDDDRADAG